MIGDLKIIKGARILDPNSLGPLIVIDSLEVM